MMNVVIFYNGKHPAKVADYSRLSAIMYIAPSDRVTADVVLVPAFAKKSTHGNISLGLRPILVFFFGPAVVIIGLVQFSQTDTAAFGFGYLTILYYPSLRPVRAYHTLLICRGRCPLGCPLADLKSRNGNITNPCLVRIEAVLPDTYLNIGACRVNIMEIGINNSSIILLVLLGVPNIRGKIRIP